MPPTPTPTPTPSGGPTEVFKPVLSSSGSGSTAPYDPWSLTPAFAGSTVRLSYFLDPKHGGITMAGAPSEGMSVGDFFQSFGALAPLDIKSWQEQLLAAGFKTVKATGVTDAATRSAMEEAIRESQQLVGGMGQMTLSDLLKQRAQGIAAFNKAMGLSTAGGAKRAPFVAPAYQPMSEASLDAAVETGAQATVGRSATAKEETAAEGAVTGIEKKAYAGAVATARSQYEGKTPAPETQYGQADVQQAAAAEIAKASPVEASGVNLRTALQGFMNAVKAG